MALTTRTVVGMYLGPDETPVQGYVEFTPTIAFTLGAITYKPKTLTALIESTGEIEILLPVNDTVGMTPAWKWVVEEKIPNGRVWLLDVPTDVDPLNINGTELDPSPA